MQYLDSLLNNFLDKVNLPLNKVPVVCIEEKLSIVQRFKLKQLIQTEKGRKQVPFFSKFIKNFPDCQPEIDQIYKTIMEET